MEEIVEKCSSCGQSFDFNSLKEVIKDYEKFFYCSTCYVKICDKCKHVAKELFHFKNNKFCEYCYEDIKYAEEEQELKEFLLTIPTEKGGHGNLFFQAKKILKENLDISPKDIITTIKYITDIMEIKMVDGLSLVPSFLRESIAFEREKEKGKIKNQEAITALREIREGKEEEKKDPPIKIEKDVDSATYGMINIKNLF